MKTVCGSAVSPECFFESPLSISSRSVLSRLPAAVNWPWLGT